MKKTHLNLLPSLLATACLLLAACVPQPLSQTPPHAGQAQRQRALKGPYTGPVSLKIDTSLMGKTSGKVVDLSRPVVGADYSIQALPTGPIVFQESFSKSTGQLEEVTRRFSIPDVTRRYTLHVLKHEPDKGREGRIQVSLNGSWAVREKDFEGQNLEVMREGLLLSANNSLLLRLRGKAGTRFTVTLVEGGEAGTLLRRRGWEKDADLTQADRLRNNDINWFFPDDPSSLGGLQPYEGDQTSPETSDRPVGVSLANGTSARIAVGIVTVLLKEPFEANLQTLRERFPIKVLSQEDSFSERFVTLEVDFDRLSLGELPEAVQALNQRAEHDPLTDAVFSSINTAKTITLAALLESQALDLIYGVSLRNLGEAEGAIDTQEEIASMPLTDLTRTKAVTKTPPSIPVLASKLWWLDAVKARDAWNYSMGEDATVAVIDSGFGILSKNANKIPSKPDFDNRIIFSQGESYLRNCVLAKGDTPAERESDCDLKYTDDALSPVNQLQHPPGHGLWAASVLVSGDNDNDGIVGVAPRAKFVPMFHNNGIEEPIAHQLERLYNDGVHVDVVSMSLSRGVNAYDYYFANKSYQNKFRNPTQPVPILPGKFAKPPEPGKDPDLNPSIERLYRAIYRLSEERKVIFVAAAGNNDKTYDPSLGLSFPQDVRIPACMDQVISVGAYQVENNQPRRAKFDTFTDDEPIGSNYGLLADIFAPGKGIWVQGYEPSGGVFIPSWHVIDGTSFATPIVAGTVAMMKSINKNLMFKDVYNILRNKGTKLDHLSFNEGLRSPVDSFGLNSLEAVKAAAGTSPENKAAKTHCLQYLPSLSLLKDVNETVPGSGSVEALFKGQYLPTLVRAESGEYFEVVGWTSRERPGIASNRLETIQYKRSSEALCRAAAGGSGGFQVASVQPPDSPPEVKVWLTGTSQGVEVDSSKLIGLGIEGPNLDQLEILIDGKPVNIRTIAQNYVTFNLPVETNPGLKDVLIKLAGSQVTLAQALKVLAMPPLQEVQTLPTYGALGMSSFTLGNIPYLGIANSFTDAQLYRWNGAQFEIFQSFPTNRGYDMAAFTIGANQYLSIANWAVGSDNSANIYRWNGSQFVYAQSLPTRGATDTEPFVMNGEQYLAVANNGYFRSSNYLQPSQIYKWDGTQFVEVQSIMTDAAYKWKHFQMGTGHYLAMISYKTTGPVETLSQIYKWNGSQFQLIQQIPGLNPIDWEAFSIGGNHFLAFSQYGTADQNYEANSHIFIWNGSSFVPFQEILGQGARKWKAFQVDGIQYLMLANDYNASRIYRWTGGRFELYRTLLGDGKWDWEFVTVGQNEYLISGSIYYANGSYQTPSEVYRFE